MEKIICVSLGGSGVTDSSGLNFSNIKKFTDVLARNKNYRFIIVVGGGNASRLYQASASHIIKSKRTLFEIGIQVTRLNAFAVMCYAKGRLDVYPKVVESLSELKGAIKKNKIVFMGGLKPGLTTDSTTTLVCKEVKSKLLVNLSSVPYVYDRPPGQKGAIKYKQMSYDQLVALSNKYDKRNPISNFIFDKIASRIAKRQKIEIRFAGYSPDSFARAIKGNHNGTTVK